MVTIIKHVVVHSGCHQSKLIHDSHNELMFRGDLFVTIAEIHMLILDQCAKINNFFIYHLVSLKRSKIWCHTRTVLL